MRAAQRIFFGRVRIDRGESRSNRAVGRAPVCVAARDRRWCGYRRTDIGAAAIAAGLQSPRVGVVFRLRQCDKKNQDWREGPPLTVPAKVSICRPGLHPPVNSNSNERRIQLSLADRERFTQNIGRFKTTIRSETGPGAGGNPLFFFGALSPELDGATGRVWPSADKGFEFAGHGGDDGYSGHGVSAGFSIWVWPVCIVIRS